MNLVLLGVPHAIHVGFFLLEAVFFDRPGVHKGIFRVRDPIMKEPIKIWATNQGFYNLFLALGGFYGLYLISIGNPAGAKPLLQVLYAAYAAAGAVLLFTTGKAAGAAAQTLPALACLYAIS